MTPVLSTDRGVTLVGGGRVDPRLIRRLAFLAPVRVAADSGADALLNAGIMPEAVIGDLDSVSQAARLALSDRLHRVAEQDSTDFEKCLQRIDAPFIVAVGFDAPRMDHALAALSTLARKVGPPVVMIAGDDAVLACPAEFTADLPPGTRLSLFPMGPARAAGCGLRWPVDGVGFSPDGRIGTSNETTGPVTLTVNGPMLLILPVERLDTAIQIARRKP